MNLLKLCQERHVFAAVGNFSFRHLIVKIDRTFTATCHFIYNDKVSVINEENRTTVFQVLVARIFGH